MRSALKTVKSADVQDAVRFALEAWEARLVELESVRSN